MRKAFVQSLVAEARKDPRIVLLTADLGYAALEPFMEEFPDRFFNVGVAEQNMVAMATGLAEAGFVPFCYSIVNFSVLRPYEFIRNGPIGHQLPVRIVGMGGGLDYSTNGVSHYGLEDLGVLRVQPAISLFAPADGAQTKSVIAQTAGIPGPVYYRLGKDDSLVVPGLDGRFTPGVPELISTGSDALILALGGISAEAAHCIEILRSKGIQAGLAIVSTLQPVDTGVFAELIGRYPLVISVEAHYRNGGLGSLLAEIIAEGAVSTRLIRCALNQMPDGITGTLPFMYSRFGIGRNEIANAVLRGLAR